MNREETKRVLKILSVAYPRYFSGMSKEDKVDHINLYMDMFGGYPVEIVLPALNNYIRHNEYPPSIAGLQRQIDLLSPQKDDATELWNILAKACRRGSVMTQEEFEQLPEPIQAWCGDVAQIKELSQMDSATFNSVTRGQFLKTVNLITERQKAQKIAESEMQKLLGNGMNFLKGV